MTVSESTATTAEQAAAFEAWAILELMGHRRLGGFVREVQLAGAGFLRIDVPGDAEGEVHSTQFYPPSSVYCLTPVTEASARAVARSSRPQPVHAYELPSPPRRQGYDDDDDDGVDDDGVDEIDGT